MDAAATLVTELIGEPWSETVVAMDSSAVEREEEDIVSLSAQRSRIAKRIFTNQGLHDNPAKIMRRLANPDVFLCSSNQKMDLLHRLGRAYHDSRRNGDRKVIMVVLALLQDTDQQVRRSALDALEHLVHACMHAFVDRQPCVHACACGPTILPFPSSDWPRSPNPIADPNAQSKKL